jgi:hypothetical protein
VAATVSGWLATTSGSWHHHDSMGSGLPQGMLAQIWGLVDTQQRGKLDFSQLGYLLGLISQAQRGEELDPASVGPATPPPSL